MPKAVRFYKTGGPENLVIEDVPLGQPGEGEAKLRVEAVGLNRAESMYYHGFYFEQPVLPSRLGYEAAGIVEAVGPGVEPSWVGKKISTIPGFSQNKYGVLGEEAIVPASAMREYPSKFSAAEGASIWMQYLTAWGALIHYGKAGPGDFVLIPAASSSVGLAAIQLVKDAGATPIATTRTSKKRGEIVAMGADHVIATTEEDLPKRVAEITGDKGARIIFDPVAGPYVETLAAAAAVGGILYIYGNLSMQPTPFPLMQAFQKRLMMRTFSMPELAQQPDVMQTATKYIVDRLADGRLKPKVAKTFPFAQSVDAYRYLESNEQIGKVVITL